MSQLDAVLLHVDANLDAALDRLFQVIRMKSISTDHAYDAETRRNAPKRRMARRRPCLHRF
jgi:hypothetical protein